MDYDVKANLTTVLSTYLIPMLLGLGLTAETSNALVGLIVALIIVGFNMLNEMYTSKHLTKDKEDVMGVDEPVEEVLELEEDDSPVYAEDNDVDLPEFEGELVSMNKLE